jgi:hypothetical protein
MRKSLIIFFITYLALSANAQISCPSIIDLTQMQTQDPARYQRFMDLETFTANYIVNQNNPDQRLINPNGIITIPVVVHVLHRGEAIGTGRNISLAQIQSEIDVLNEDFRRLNADRVNTPAAFTGVAADYGFEFRLACIDPNGNTTNGVVRRQTNHDFIYIVDAGNNPDENAMGIKMTNLGGDDPWPTNRYLNIWVANFTDNLLGYATFPADFAVNPNVDGVVVKTTAFGRTGNVAAPFNRGRTTTHEVGHWLNLRHIWGDAVCGDDFVADTPPQMRENFGCPNFPHIAVNEGNGWFGPRCNPADPSSMFMNYMDYTNDDCRNIFTVGQGLRGRAIFAPGGPRAAFLENYFSIQQPANSIQCTGTINLTNPLCLSPVNWTIVSGPANITSGQGTNQLKLQATGNGTVQLRATAGNYVSDVSFSVTTNIPNLAISGYPTVCNNRSNYYSVDLPPASSIVWSSSPSGKVNLAPAGPNGVVAIPINSPTGSYTLTGTISGSCTSAATLVVTFNTTPPAYTCSDVGNGTCTEYVPLCTSRYYDGRGFSVPNSFLVVPYWHWTVYGGKFSDGTTDAIIPWNVPGLFVKPDFPTSSCNISIKPMNECFVEDAYPPFQYIMINTGQNCYGSYTVSPNPASSDVTISTVQSAETKADRSITAVNIYSQEGNLKKQRKFGKVKTASISISDLVNGMYVVEIISGDYREQKQLVVQH